MKLIVGLGNPGKEYENTRHNFGFMAILHFYASHKDIFNGWKEKFNALVSEGQLNGEKIMLVLPQTYMNSSGVAVVALAKYLKLVPSLADKLFRVFPRKISRVSAAADNLWVIHDDIDLPIGTTRLSTNAASGGHKGIESVIKHLGGKNFIRFRLGINSSSRGINPPPAGTSFKKGGIISTEHFVLGKFNEEENRLVEEVLHKTTNALDRALEIGVEKAMNEYNKS